MAHKTIVVLVMLVRQFVFGIGLFVMAFWCLHFLDNMFNRMHRLEHNRKKYGCSCNQIEYGEFRLHLAKIGMRL